jgi:hypothetical protein
MPFKNKIMPQSTQVPSQESSSERASRFYKEGQAAAEKVRKKWGDSFMKIMNKKEEEFKKKERLLQGVIVFLCILCVILFMNGMLSYGTHKHVRRI